MSAPIFQEPSALLDRDPAAMIRQRAVSDAKFLRALAHRALVDGLPKPELRAATARAAARSVLIHARHVSRLVEPLVVASAQLPTAESLCSTIDR